MVLDSTAHVISVDAMRSSEGDGERTFKSREDAFRVLRARLELVGSKHRIQRVNSNFLSDLANQLIVKIEVVPSDANSQAAPAVSNLLNDDELLDDYVPQSAAKNDVPEPVYIWKLDMGREVHLNFNDERYVGNRGLVCAAEFAQCFLPQLKSISFANSGLFSNITSPTTIDGNKTLEMVTNSLMGIGTLEYIDVSRNSLGTRAYVILSRFLKETTSVVKIDMEGTLMSEGELRHLSIIIDGNIAKQKRKLAKKGSNQASNGTNPNETSNTTHEDQHHNQSIPEIVSNGKFFTDSKLKALLSREPTGGSSKPEDYPTNLGEALPMDAKGNFRRYQVDFSIGKGQKHGGSPFGFAIHPTQRLYQKSEGTRQRLARIVRETPQFRSFVLEAFPPIEAAATQATAALVALRKTLDVGLSLAEQEQINLEAKQNHQIQSILMFIVDSLQRADYRIGDDLLVEAGDTPLWVGLLEHPTNCTVVASKKGSEPSSVLVTATYPTGTFFGDMEILQSVITPTARPNRITSLHIEESSTHQEKQQQVISDSVGRSSFIAGTPTTTSITPPNQADSAAGVASGGNATTWLLSRDLYVRILAPFLAARRKRYNQLIEEMPGIYGIPHMSKMCLSEIISEHIFNPNERFERDCRADPSLNRKYAIEMKRASYTIFDDSILATHIMVVAEGRVSLKKGVSELAQFSRGSVINVLDDVDAATGVSSRKGMVIESAPVAMHQVNLWMIPRDSLVRAPIELRMALEDKGATYRGVTKE